MLPPPFQNAREFRAAFGRGLGEMLGQPDLGGFILVLANAGFDRELHGLLGERLRGRFTELAQEYRGLLRDGRPLPGAPDDVLVFLKLLVVGWEGLRPVALRRVGPWEIQFNHLRAFRPPRLSHAAVSGLHRPFDAGGFHFDKPFLRRETLWEGELAGRPLRLLYNKFPFAELHGLLVPEPAARRPQFLTADDHAFVWHLAELLGPGMPGVGFGYNAQGAYASVNHLHFQMYLRGARDAAAPHYPVEDPCWQHNGGAAPYPLAVTRCAGPREAWEFIAGLHAAGRSYNLLYRPGTCYVTPRASQGSYAHAAWTAGFAWSEVAGAFTIFNGADYAALDEERIRAEFALLAPA